MRAKLFAVSLLTSAAAGCGSMPPPASTAPASCDELAPLLAEIHWTEADADAVSDELADSLSVVRQLQSRCEGTR